MTQRIIQRRDERQDYETPPDLFDSLSQEFGPFDVDVAASASTAKCARFWTRETDGLAQDWTGLRCYMNPEYRIAKKFCKKAAESKALVVALLPARTDTAWFHDYVQGRAEIRFLRGRVKFLIGGKPILNPKSGKPAGGKFPSMIAIWRNLPDGAQ